MKAEASASVIKIQEQPAKKQVPPEVQKKMSNLQRKVNEVKTLKEKKEQGFFMNQSQLDKIQKENEFKNELEALEAQYRWSLSWRLRTFNSIFLRYI